MGSSRSRRPAPGSVRGRGAHTRATSLTETLTPDRGREDLGVGFSDTDLPAEPWYHMVDPDQDVVIIVHGAIEPDFLWVVDQPRGSVGIIVTTFSPARAMDETA